MELHHLFQDYISNGRGAETKLFKLQQIDAINVKNVQDVIHVLRGKFGNMWFGGHKGTFSRTP